MLTDADRQRMEAIGNDADAWARVDPDSIRWLCALVRRMDGELAVYEHEADAKELKELLEEMRND